MIRSPDPLAAPRAFAMGIAAGVVAWCGLVAATLIAMQP